MELCFRKALLMLLRIPPPKAAEILERELLLLLSKLSSLTNNTHEWSCYLSNSVKVPII